MRKYEGVVEEVRQPAGVIFNFLSDFRHFEKFLPEQIHDWEATADYCVFSVQGMGKLKLTYVSRDPDTKIVIQPSPDSGFPVPFFLTTLITQNIQNPSTAEFQFVVDADVNPMLSVVVDKPLKQFVEIITMRLKTYLNEEYS